MEPDRPASSVYSSDILNQLDIEIAHQQAIGDLESENELLIQQIIDLETIYQRLLDIQQQITELVIYFGSIQRFISTEIAFGRNIWYANCTAF